MKFSIQVTGEDISRMKALERRGRSLGVLLELELLFTDHLRLDLDRLQLYRRTLSLISRVQLGYVRDDAYEKRLYTRLASMVSADVAALERETSGVQ